MNILEDIKKAFHDNNTGILFDLKSMSNNTFELLYCVDDKEESFKTLAKLSYFLATLDMQYYVTIIILLIIAGTIRISFNLEQRIKGDDNYAKN